MGTLKLVSLAAALLVFTSVASADTLTFTHEGRGSGTLDGESFPTSDFIITAFGDTDDRQTNGRAWWIDHRSVSITISGLGNLDILSDTRTFVNNGGGIVGFSRTRSSGGADLFNGPTDPVFGAWEMLDPIGPIAGEGTLLQWTRDPQINTTAGILIFDTGLTPATFTAIPEPSTLVILAIGGMVAMRRR